MTSSVGVSSVSRLAGAHRVMNNYFAVSINSTCARTRVHTFFTDTSFVKGTVTANSALGFTLVIGIAIITRKTTTVSAKSYGQTFCI